MPVHRPPVVLVTACDNGFALPLAVTLYSALSTLDRGREVRIFHIDGGLEARLRQRIERVLAGSHPRFRLEWVTPDTSRLAGLTTSGWQSSAAFLRLLLPESLPSELKRAVYLDSDLVVSADLGLLMDMDLGGHLALAVQDYWNPTVSLGLKATHERLGLAAETVYCNTGVMAVDLERWRAEEVTQRVLSYTRDHPETIRLADQDGINAVVAGDWGLLDPRWNVMISALPRFGQQSGLDAAELARRRQELLRSAHILHFTGPHKPWHFRTPGFAERRFYEVARTCGWFHGAGYASWYYGGRARRALKTAPRRVVRWLRQRRKRSSATAC